jgi:hypothetical protein
LKTLKAKEGEKNMNEEMENEMLETTNETENVGTQATEETVGIEISTQEEKKEEKRLRDLLKENPNYQEEFNNIMKSRISRERNEIESKYSKLANVVKTGLNTNSIEEATNRLTEFYEENGIKIQHNLYTEQEEQILAEKLAENIINDGYEEIVNEVEKLSSKRIEEMTPREKIMLQKLGNERVKIEQAKELQSLGINDNKFLEFSNKLNPSLSIKEKYDIYKSLNKKEETIEKIGSMKSNIHTTENKDYYTPEEVDKLTEKELRDPKIMAIVDKSMIEWYSNKTS